MKVEEAKKTEKYNKKRTASRFSVHNFKARYNLTTTRGSETPPGQEYSVLNEITCLISCRSFLHYTLQSSRNDSIITLNNDSLRLHEERSPRHESVIAYLIRSLNLLHTDGKAPLIRLRRQTSIAVPEGRRVREVLGACVGYKAQPLDSMCKRWRRIRTRGR